MLKTLQGFKDFMLRGNVVDLAVGIVIGAAFTSLVGSFSTAFILPLLKLLGTNPTAADPNAGGSFNLFGQRFPWAEFVNGVIAFTITAAVLYFLVVLPMNKYNERRTRGQTPEPEEVSAEIALLTEIRDALVRQGGVPPQRSAAPDHAADSGVSAP